MNQQIHDFVPPSAELVALGEPTHSEPAFQWTRNAVFAQLVAAGFRSIALETDRVAAWKVNDYVLGRGGDLDDVLATGFTHTFGSLAGNRALVEWLRTHNAAAADPADRVRFHGFDLPTEMTSAPSPRTYLEHTRDYLALDWDIAALTGPDDDWSREEAVLDPKRSPGATPASDRLRTLADDLLSLLYVRAPALVAATSHESWLRAHTHCTAALGLLRYHRTAATDTDLRTRISLLSAVRDAQMAQNLLDIRHHESPRGATLVSAHNLHLQRPLCTWSSPLTTLDWPSAGSILTAVSQDYFFIPSTTDDLQLPTPPPPSSSWHLLPPNHLRSAPPRTSPHPDRGYFPLDQATIDTADAILQIMDTTKTTNELKDT
ncbi:erythromycin esterase family protein [Amycolatopsis sp. NPDC051903]|uniref:erythromycin esterase family protein n=1 Tax=Amycolatopsis sp. NPDC051903 TaxID=3363936 RepID=UPI00379476EB